MAAKNGNGLILVDGSMDFSEGVNSNVVTTVESAKNPNGLKRTQVSWMNNATVRHGGIVQRMGWHIRGRIPFLDMFQGQKTYVPFYANPYLIMVIGGHVIRVDPDNPGAAIDLSTMFHLTLPITERCYFCQAEEFMIIQAGDNVTNPLIWDGNRLFQSPGLAAGWIPWATAMCYYMGRLWYAQGKTYGAGDIVGGPSGTLPYQFRDALLRVTENPLCLGGDNFAVPTNAGNIRGIAYASNINTQLGQGILYVGTREQIYSLTVPATRTDWINADVNNGPLQVAALVNNGWVNDRSIVSVNGDLFFQSLEPAIRSLTTAVRNFQQWGNVPISVNESRILQFNDRNLLRFGSGIYFDNRLIETALPFTVPVGVAHKALIPLNFDVISTFQRTLPPCWEGLWEGLDVLELSTEDYGGRQRAFASVWSERYRCIELWELTDSERWDDNQDPNFENRVAWYVEFPAFTWGDEFELKKMVSAEIWLDKILGEVMYKMEYRPDSDPCWYMWHQWKLCTAKDCREDVHAPVCVYPQIYRESYRQTITLPTPPNICASVMGRPSNIGYQMQCKLSVKGWCRVRALLLKAEHVQSQLFGDMVC
jgi:hypothetical protein